ncbi:hypothetical protein KCU78_g11, partial [Aureobasidium melanogenum]
MSIEVRHTATFDRRLEAWQKSVTKVSCGRFRAPLTESTLVHVHCSTGAKQGPLKFGKAERAVQSHWSEGLRACH